MIMRALVDLENEDFERTFCARFAARARASSARARDNPLTPHAVARSLAPTFADARAKPPF